MQKITAEEMFSFSNMCAYIVILAICAIFFKDNLKNCLVLKSDDANNEIVSGKIIHKWSSGSGKARFRNYKYAFVFNGEEKRGKFDARITFSFTNSYERGDYIDILYNKRTNFFFPKDALTGEIVEYIVLIVGVSFLAWFAFVYGKWRLANCRIS